MAAARDKPAILWLCVPDDLVLFGALYRSEALPGGIPGQNRLRACRMSVVSDVFLCGWRVQSEIPLPELLPWTTPAHNVDIYIRLGTVPPILNVLDGNWSLTMDGNGLCRVDIPGVCIFSMRAGCEIVIEPAPAADPVELRNYLFGTGLGLICHQRGVFPLHGSCLSFGSHAVVFSGDSGAGKSTLAAALARRGYPLLADDVAVLENRTGGWVVRPAFPRVKLWPTSFRAVLGVRPGQSPVDPRGKRHFQFEPVPAFDPGPVPLGAIYFLEQLEDGQPESVVEVRGIEKLQLIRSQVFRRRMGRALGRKAFLRGTALQLAGAVAVRRLRRSFDLSRIDATIARIEQLHGCER
jgi:hypothetical protein